MSAVRASLIGVALLYFLIGKVAFEPRLALGDVSLNQLLQLVMLAGLAALPWCGKPRQLVRSRSFWLTAALALLLAVRSVGAENSSYAPAKPIGYLGLVIPSLALLGAMLRSAIDVRRFMICWAVVGSGMMILGVMLLLGGDPPPRLAILGGGANGYARIVGTAFLLWVGLGLPRSGKGRWLYLVGHAGFAVTLLFAGSKTAVLGIGVALAVLGWNRRNPRLLFGAIAGTMLFVSAPHWTHELVHRIDKNRGEVRMFREPDIDDPRGSYGTRITYYTRSVSSLRSSGWQGVGTGDWHSVVGLPSGRRHPHNMILELMCELGVLGILWLGMLLLNLIRWTGALHRERVDPQLVSTLIAVLIFWVFNAQLNGDLLDNRWILLVVMLLEIIALDRGVLTPLRFSARGKTTSSLRAEVVS